MGFGCNAVGVVGCRIIDSKRERMIAMLTNAFVPCNGRFPTLVALISLFFVATSGFWASLGSAFVLTGLIALSVLVTFFASWVLSRTVLRGEPSSFTLELPPYRSPEIGKVIIRSVLDRTLFVLGRAVAVAAPAGLILWLLANLRVGDVALLQTASAFLDPVGEFFGVDGVILLALFLALPANEIFLPIALMAYTAGGSLVEYSGLWELKEILLANGWTLKTAICVALLVLFHFPCSTTLMTIRKETGKTWWMILAALLPMAFGLALCAMVSIGFSLFT